MLPNCDNSTAPAPDGGAEHHAWQRAMRVLVPKNLLIAASVDLNVQVANLLAQRVAVEAQQVRRPDLIAPGRRERRRSQRLLDVLAYAVIETRRRHAIGETREMR